MHPKAAQYFPLLFLDAIEVSTALILSPIGLEKGRIERLEKSLKHANRVTGSLAIVFARLLIQYGDGNCKKDYCRALSTREGRKECHLGKSIFTWENSAEIAARAAKSEQARMFIGTPFVKSVCLVHFIHLIPKWRPINYSFVYMLISPLGLVNMYKKKKNFELKTRRRGLINMQTKE